MPAPALRLHTIADASTAPRLPEGLTARFAAALSAEGAVVPGRLGGLLRALAEDWRAGEPAELTLIDARSALHACGLAVEVGRPPLDTRADAPGPAAWGSLWFAPAAEGWQLWECTAQSGWHRVAGEGATPSGAGYLFGRAVARASVAGPPVAGTGDDASRDAPGTGEEPARDGIRAYAAWAAGLLKGRVGGIAAASLLVNLGLLVMPLFAMIVYDKVVSNGIFETLWALAFGVLVFQGIEIGVRVLRARQVERLAQVLDERIDRQLFAALLQPARRAGSQPGLAARFLTRYQELGGARDFFSATYLLAVADLPFVLLVWLAIGIIAWPLLLVVLAWTALYVIAGTLLKQRGLYAARAFARGQVAKQAVLTDALSSLDLLRTSHAGGLLFRRFMTHARDNALNAAWVRDEAARGAHLSQLVHTGTYVSLIVAGAYLVFDRQLSVGALVAASMLSSRTLGVTGAALITLGRWKELQRALGSLSAFLVPGEGPADGAAPGPVSRSPEAVAGRITVHGLRHEYTNGRPALAGFDLTIEAGERVALLGRPGSGKSTLARALAGAIAPTGGEVRVDNVSLLQHDASGRSRWLAFKPQEPGLVAGTVEDNILAGLPPHADEAQRMLALERGLHLSGLDRDLARGSLALDHRVEEYGANLSGGQRQKIALARTFALPARIVILDEPTNGLDPESEKLLVSRLAQLRDTTMIVATHSATMLSLTERVIALGNGVPVADGRTAELVRTD